MADLRVAARYAESLIELAEDMKIADKVAEDMKNLLATVKENRELKLFLNSPLVKPDNKLSALKKIFSNFQDLTLRFIRLLVKNHREMFLPAIAEEYIHKLNNLRNIQPIRLTAAYQLDPSVKDAILAKLKQKVSGTIELEEKIDESLIGGFVVRMGDTRIDASVSSQIVKMKQRLMKK